MTRDEIIQIAREAGTPYVNRHYPGVTSFGFTEHALERFAALVAEAATEEANARANKSWTLMCEKMVAAEREACAKVCEEAKSRIFPFYDKTTLEAAHNVATNLADAIRARGAA